MLSQKKITEKFEVTRTTLYNWKTTKPKLFNLLVNSDRMNTQLREYRIILEKYSKTLKGEFVSEEITYILMQNLENYLENIECLENLFIIKTSKDLKEKSDFILDIYHKIKALNIVNRYIFISRIKSIKKQRIKQSDLQTAIKHYFKEFLKTSE